MGFKPMTFCVHVHIINRDVSWLFMTILFSLFSHNACTLLSRPYGAVSPPTDHVPGVRLVDEAWHTSEGEVGPE